MFLTNAYSGYNRSGEQSAAGLFLILFSSADVYIPPTPEDERRNLPVVKACVRHARMTQLGHFMMATVRVGPHRVTLSGAYGADGLTLGESDYPGIWLKLVELPVDLTRKFWNGGGHNSSGSEAKDMRAWAMTNMAALRKAGR